MKNRQLFISNSRIWMCGGLSVFAVLGLLAVLIYGASREMPHTTPTLTERIHSPPSNWSTFDFNPTACSAFRREVSGRLSSSDGKPLAATSITIESASSDGCGKAHYQVVSDGAGNFTFPPLLFSYTYHVQAQNSIRLTVNFEKCDDEHSIELTNINETQIYTEIYADCVE